MYWPWTNYIRVIPLPNYHCRRHLPPFRTRNIRRSSNTLRRARRFRRLRYRRNIPCTTSGLSFLPPVLEAPEAHFLLRVDEVDGPHRQLRETSCAPDCSPQRLGIGDAHSAMAAKATSH